MKKKLDLEVTVIALHKCVGGDSPTFIRPNTKQAALVSPHICFPGHIVNSME